MARITVGASSQSQIPPPHSSTRASSGTSGAAHHRRVGALRRLRADAERHHREAVERVGLEQLAPGQHAEPEVALALARAQREVGGGEVRGGRPPDDPVQPRARRGGLAARRLDHLDDGRVVEVHDEPRRLAPDAREQPRRQQLGDHDVVRRGRRRSARRSRRARPRAARSARRPARSAPGAARVTRTSAASARASSYARMAGPAIRSPTGSAETTRTRGVGKPGSMAAIPADSSASALAALYGSMLAVTGSRHTPVALLGAGLTLLVLAWVFGNPPGAAPDERAHYVRALGAGGLQLAGATFEPTEEQREAFLGAAGKGEPLRGRASPPCCGPRSRRARSTSRARSASPRSAATTGARRSRRRVVDQPPAGPRSRRVPTYTGTYAPFAYVVPGAVMRTQGSPAAALRAGRLRERADLPRAADRRDRAAPAAAWPWPGWRWR